MSSIAGSPSAIRKKIPARVKRHAYVGTWRMKYPGSMGHDEEGIRVGNGVESAERKA